jgi:hypothetical protein
LYPLSRSAAAIAVSTCSRCCIPPVSRRESWDARHGTGFARRDAASFQREPRPCAEKVVGQPMHAIDCVPRNLSHPTREPTIKTTEPPERPRFGSFQTVALRRMPHQQWASLSTSVTRSGKFRVPNWLDGGHRDVRFPRCERFQRVGYHGQHSRGQRFDISGVANAPFTPSRTHSDCQNYYSPLLEVHKPLPRSSEIEFPSLMRR